MIKIFNRVRFERATVSLMIDQYCRQFHGGTSLCSNCRSLKEYAFSRIANCRFLPAKPVCSACAVHCYKPAMREEIRKVMRFSGPRILLHHPVRAIIYLSIKKRRLAH